MMSASVQTDPLASLKRRVFNPHRLSGADLERSFIARRQTLEDILRDVAAEAPESHPQHHLVCGQRGMGKTTLLLRIAVALRDAPLRERFVPLTFPEDQYVEVDRLSKFWLNCLDALADALEQQGGATAEVERIDGTVKEMEASSADEETLAADGCEAFAAAIERLGRRPVLLIDNFSLLLGRLRAHDYRLRGFFGAAGAPVIIAAAVAPPADFEDYGAAFYDGFRTRVLRPLSLEELRSVIMELARETGRSEVLARLPKETPRLVALRDLTGGNPRTAVLLFEMFSQGFSQDAYEDLDGLLDIVTPLYQSRLDQLSGQAQVIVGSLARYWRPATAAILSALTRIPTSSISPQLGRLEAIGLVEKTAFFPEKKTGYQIAERFFNIWYLMRSGNRRQRASLACLTRFLQEFHTPAELERHARRLLSRGRLDAGQIPYAIALAGALAEYPGLAYHLEARAQMELLRLTEGIRERIAQILDPDEIDPRILSFAELERALRQAVPPDSPVSGVEFADLVLSSPAMLGTNEAGTATRHAIAATSLTAEQVEDLVGRLRQERHNLELVRGEEAVRWLLSRLREGLITSWDDAREVSNAILEAESSETVSILLSFAGTDVKASLDEGAFDRVRSALRPALGKRAKAWYDWGVRLGREFARYDEAAAAYRHVVELDPTDWMAWHNLGFLLQEYLSRYEEAEAAYRAEIRIKPGSSSAWNNLGNLLAHHLHRVSEAEAALRKSIELDPRDAMPWYNIGVLLTDQLGRHRDAEVAFRRAVEIAPDYPYAWHNLGALLADGLARYEEAEVAYSTAVHVDPRLRLTWNSLGKLLADRLGRWEEARGAFEKALELDPSEDSPRHNLAFLLRDFLGRPEDARRVLADIHDREAVKDTQALHDALFAAYDENWGLAAEALRRALGEAEFRLPPNTRDDWLRASAVLLHLGYGEKLVALLDAEGADMRMLPWFAAVNAHARGDRRYLANAPAEARPAAERIFDEIEARRSRLPARPKRSRGR
ncbi:MAG: tetratricopeptide repeat protein [Armatimonadetes bacterium]|nr:tetratricopeptide repeat protein [Armatimonadota bacterium]